MNGSFKLYGYFRKPFICLLFLLVITLSFNANLRFADAEALSSQQGKQVMPLAMDGYYVLFPGGGAPFLKSGKLMVPVREFAQAIGAELQYNPQWKSVNLLSLGQKVEGIRAGRPSVVYDSDMGLALGATPEIRNGKLFAPASPLLRGLGGYGYEINVNQYDQPRLIVTDKKFDRLLSHAKPRLLGFPYPYETTANGDPFYPLSVVQTEASASEFKLDLSLQNVTGATIKAGNAQFEIIAVGSDGLTTVRRMDGPFRTLGKAGKISLSVTLPAQADEVYFRSRIVKEPGESNPIDQDTLTRLASRVIDQVVLFQRAGVITVSSVAADGRIVLTLRVPDSHREPVPSDKLDLVRNELYEQAGFPIPLDLQSFVPAAEPPIVGTIASVDSAGRMLRVLDESREQDEHSGKIEPYTVSLTEDIAITDAASGKRLSIESLRKGQQIACYPAIDWKRGDQGIVPILEISVGDRNAATGSHT